MSRRLSLAGFAVAALLVGIALWDYVEARRLSATIETIRAAGEPVLNDISRLRPQSDEQKEASRYYAAAGMLVRDGWGRRFGKVDEQLTALLASQAPSAPAALVDELARIVEQHHAFFEILDRAAALDARGLAYGDEPRFSIPDRSYSSVNGLRVAYLSLTGQPAEAVKALRSTVSVTRISSHLWKVGLETNRDLELLLTYAPPSVAELQNLQQAFESMSIDDDARELLLRERARLITMIWPAAASAPSVLPRVRNAAPRGSALINLLQRPLYTRRVNEAIRMFDPALTHVAQPWPAKFDAVEAFVETHPRVPVAGTLDGGLKRYFSDLVPSMWPVNDFAVGAVQSATRAAARDITRKGLGVTALAIERFRREHGSKPPSALAELVPRYLPANIIDPYSGQPFSYRTTPESYVVYSIGANRVDDGGDSSPVSQSNVVGAGAAPPKDITIKVRFNP